MLGKRTGLCLCPLGCKCLSALCWHGHCSYRRMSPSPSSTPDQGCPAPAPTWLPGFQSSPPLRSLDPTGQWPGQGCVQSEARVELNQLSLPGRARPAPPLTWGLVSPTSAVLMMLDFTCLMSQCPRDWRSKGEGRNNKTFSRKQWENVLGVWELAKISQAEHEKRRLSRDKTGTLGFVKTQNRHPSTAPWRE